MGSRAGIVPVVCTSGRGGDDYVFVVKDGDRGVIPCRPGRDHVTAYPEIDRRDVFIRCKDVQEFTGEI